MELGAAVVDAGCGDVFDELGGPSVGVDELEVTKCVGFVEF